ncbi:aspartate aminotransferase [Aquisalimonas asiatica]|uniref:Aspartate aminotransferase n=2 Tax=Aquisalimonas asiatica TaxID=406100 RepID=A0A1H8QVS9_9GAMM|nr:aspartate aminotransferase [Aquisalimonas asiatica]
MDPETLAVGAEALPYFRTDEFSEKMVAMRDRIQRVCRASASSRLAVITGSGTAAMEAAVASMFGGDDRVLVINGGGFGERFSELCRCHSIPYNELILAHDEELDAAHFEGVDGRQYTGLLVNVHETSTGQLYDMSLISGFCREYGLTLVVDAISSLLADDYRMDEWGVDATIFSSHKALAVSPGLSFVLVNEETWHSRIAGKRRAGVFYLDLRDHIMNMERGQTPFTPSVGVVLQVEEKLARVEARGVSYFLHKTRCLAEGFREDIKKRTNLVVPGFRISNALTPLFFPDGGAEKCFSRLRDDHGLIVTPSGGENKDKMIRVGHMGNLTQDDHDTLVSALAV